MTMALTERSQNALHAVTINPQLVQSYMSSTYMMTYNVMNLKIDHVAVSRRRCAAL